MVMGQETFNEAVIALIPQLRAYATALTHSRWEADDLVQETLMRAWRYRTAFQPGTPLKPWLFQILRTRLYTDFSKPRLVLEDIDGKSGAELTCPAEQDWRAEYNELLQALQGLHPESREAILLVLGSGFTYAEAAGICGCAVGTMKSRVNRAREHLIQMLDSGPGRRPPHADHFRFAPAPAGHRSHG